MGVQIPYANEPFLRGEGMPGHTGRHSTVSCEKRLNRSRCRLGCYLGGSKETCVTWVAHRHHMVNTIELSCSGGPNEAAAMRAYFKLL